MNVFYCTLFYVLYIKGKIYVCSVRFTKRSKITGGFTQDTYIYKYLYINN